MASAAAAGDAAAPGLDPATVAAASQTFASLAIGSCAPAVGALDGEVEAHLNHIDAISANLENVRARACAAAAAVRAVECLRTEL